ncbi:MAG: undecaprenyl diphosphate synthase family protein [Bacillota bacterium]
MRRKYRRLPKHIGVIPDGNRRWAQARGLEKQDGYSRGLDPGIMLYEICMELGIPELTFYGFTQDNNKRPAVQREAFKSACCRAVKMLSERDASLLVIGDHTSPYFPSELVEYTRRKTFGNGGMRVNFLVNYGWKWDLKHMLDPDSVKAGRPGANLLKKVASSDVSRIDLIIRWGGRRRLSGFLPLQTIYSDFYVVDDMWPDFRPEHVYEALEWYQTQDVTLGG